MAFLCLIDGVGGNLELAVVHQLMKYTDMPGEVESGYHDRVLGLLGDIMPYQYPTVEIPSTAFHLVGVPTRVPTTEAMEAHIVAWADPTVPLGPFTDQDPEGVSIQKLKIQVSEFPTESLRIILGWIFALGE